MLSRFYLIKHVRVTHDFQRSAENLINSSCNVLRMGNECPRCGMDIMRDPIQLNSISIEDEKTYICSDCGISETRIMWFKAKNLEDKIPQEQLDLQKKFSDKLKGDLTHESENIR